MNKLRKIIEQLSVSEFNQLKIDLIENNSEKFLNVFISYRNRKITDEEIKKLVNCDENAFNVLKSRLLYKIKKLLLETNDAQQSDFSKQENSLMEYLYEYPRETATAMLHQLEKNSINNDIPQELITIYGALKRIHFYSDKYYYYSQLYNKQVAYMIALEKAEETLFNFNRTLSNYYFSRTNNDKELLNILIQEIRNIYSLNQSHRFELIKNFILIQAQLFANINLPDEKCIEDLIRKCEQTAHNYPNDKQIKYYKEVVNYFWLEYYFKINQLKKAEQYYKIINKNIKTWLLLNNYCLAFKFLLTEPELLCKFNKTDGLKGEMEEEFYLDNFDFYTQISLKFRKAIISIYKESTDKAIDVLSNLITDVSLHHFFHFEIEIKLTQAYLYVKRKKYVAADELLQKLARKISADEKAKYKNALLFIKMLKLLMNKDKQTNTQNQIQDTLEQFDFFNIGERKILSFLKTELDSTIKKVAIHH